MTDLKYMYEYYRSKAESLAIDLETLRAENEHLREMLNPHPQTKDND